VSLVDLKKKVVVSRKNVPTVVGKVLLKKRRETKRRRNKVG
jgi:hypothetical protein